MANVIINDANLTNIANAIRGKNGETTTYKPSEMAAAIGEIDTQDNSVLNSLINRSITTISNDEVTKLGSYAFSNCSVLISVNFPAVTQALGYVFYYCTQLTTVNIPLLQETPSGMFQNCSKLPKLDFPLLNTIQGSSFNSCRLLETLILRKTSVVSLKATSAFTNTLIASGTGYIYVPSSLVDSYKAATNWSTYADQIRAIEDYPEITGG